MPQARMTSYRARTRSGEVYRQLVGKRIGTIEMLTVKKFHTNGAIAFQ